MWKSRYYLSGEVVVETIVVVEGHRCNSVFVSFMIDLFIGMMTVVTINSESGER